MDSDPFSGPRECVFDLIRMGLEQMLLPCEIMSVTFLILNTFPLSLTYEGESATGSDYTTASSYRKGELESNLR
jgi:hypothetical protein